MKAEPLYVTEAEIAALVGMSAKEWEAAALVLERSGLPPRDPLFKNKRYWPACKAFLDRRNDVKALADTRVIGGAAAAERWD